MPCNQNEFAHAFRDLCARTIVTIEGHAQILPELRAVSLNAGTQLVEYLNWRTARICWGLEHQRRDGADQNGLGHTLRTVPADIARDFSSPVE